MALCINDHANFVVCLHADGQYPPEYINTFIQHMQEYNIDLLQGSRHKEGTARQGGMPIYKWFAGRILVLLENAVFDLRMTDYHSGFMLYRRTALQSLPYNHLSDSFDFDLEMIALARAHHMTIDELGIPTRYADEISHLNPFAYGFRVLGVMARFAYGHYHRMKTIK